MRFLDARNPLAADRATKTITQVLERLVEFPRVGVPIDETGTRKLVIPFGASAYIAEYRLNPDADEILIRVFRHARELGL